MIGRWWSMFGDWIANTAMPSPGRIVLWWFVLLVVWSLVRARATSVVTEADVTVHEPEASWTIRCLITFNSAFVLQNACDMVYLWGGVGLPDGMTYATYAHRGAYPLVAAALCAGAFVLVCVRPGGLAERSPLVRWLVFAFLAQTVVLTVSSWWRLDLYVDVYGLSRWRLAALAWMALVALGLIFIALRIKGQRSSRWLIEANAWAVLLVVTGAAFGDSDGLIARHNVSRSLAGQQRFDLAYTASLGTAALPALAVYSTTTQDAAAQVEVERLRGQLREELADWRSWTWRRWAVRGDMREIEQARKKP